METHQQTNSKHIGNHLSDAFAFGLISLVRIYQYLLSPWIGQNCRFTPTCSQFAIEAIQIRGPILGCSLTVRRLCKCHPWHQGGFDPVPTQSKQTKKDGF